MKFFMLARKCGETKWWSDNCTKFPRSNEPMKAPWNSCVLSIYHKFRKSWKDSSTFDLCRDYQLNKSLTIFVGWKTLMLNIACHGLIFPCYRQFLIPCTTHMFGNDNIRGKWKSTNDRQSIPQNKIILLLNLPNRLSSSSLLLKASD